MKKLKLGKGISSMLALVSIFTLTSVGVHAEWRQDNQGWWYAEGDSWSVGWRQLEGKWYYFEPDGYMVHDTTINGYNIGSDGAWIQSQKNVSSNSSKINNSTNSNNIIGQNIEQAVSQAIKSKGEGSYLGSEVATEGHIILGQEEKDGVVKVYTISSFGYFGFENGIFTKVSGSGAIPTVMIFFKNANAGYSLIGYKEPEDGEGGLDSIKEMFPERLWDKVLSKDDTVYPELAELEEIQAEEYLKQIGRNAKVSEKYVEKVLPKIDVSAENKLFVYSGKNDSFINDCPYWLGTKEKLEDGVRVIYETVQSKSSDGYDVITFRKMKADGTIIEERIYKIIGSEPILQ